MLFHFFFGFVFEIKEESSSPLFLPFLLVKEERNTERHEREEKEEEEVNFGLYSGSMFHVEYFDVAQVDRIKERSALIIFFFYYCFSPPFPKFFLWFEIVKKMELNSSPIDGDCHHRHYRRC